MPLPRFHLSLRPPCPTSTRLRRTFSEHFLVISYLQNALTRCSYVELLQISFTPAEPNAEYTVILKHKHGTEERIRGEHGDGMVTFTQKTYVDIPCIDMHLSD